MPTKKTKTKKSTKTQKQPTRNFHTNKPFIIVIAVVIILVALFVFRGWMRVTVIPKTASLFYTHSVRDTLSKENVELGYPFKQLGFTTNPRSSTCSLEIAKGISSEIDCSVSMQSYTKLPSSGSGQAAIEAQAQDLQNLLLLKGWQGGNSGVTLTGLIDGTYQGKDYSPDAYYEKVIGDDDCVFDTFIAYANPQPPAIRSTLSCDRTVNILGTPKGEFYISSKGHN